MAKYDEQFKLETVQQYLSGKISYRGLACTSGVERSQLRRWVMAYQAQGVDGLRGQRRRYSGQFKRDVLERIERDGLSDRQALALYNLRDPGVISRWRRQYDAGGLGALMPRCRGRASMSDKRPPAPISEDMTVAQMRDELAYLRAENDYLKKLKALIEAEGTEAQVKKRTWSKD